MPAMYRVKLSDFMLVLVIENIADTNTMTKTTSLWLLLQVSLDQLLPIICLRKASL